MKSQSHIKHTHVPHPEKNVFNHLTAARYSHLVPTEPLAVLFNASDTAGR